MTDAKEPLQQEVRQNWPAPDSDRTPSFAATWQAAERRLAARRRQHWMLASAAAVVAAVAVGLLLRTPPAPDASYIEMDELMGSTSWVAPSDVLLPEHQFDIYQELPSLLESTETAGGSLL